TRRSGDCPRPGYSRGPDLRPTRGAEPAGVREGTPRRWGTGGHAGADRVWGHDVRAWRRGDEPPEVPREPARAARDPISRPNHAGPTQPTWRWAGSARPVERARPTVLWQPVRGTGLQHGVSREALGDESGYDQVLGQLGGVGGASPLEGYN